MFLASSMSPIVVNVVANEDAELLENELLGAGEFSAKTSTTPHKEEQRRSRHNANERRRTNALKMREEVEALERQRARLKREPFVDKVSTIGHYNAD
ncbi:unnamed protein product [Peronospora destructor]|uniref:BZIP domain-containing protein n=1 Tax=Peronospora destructor TaxID=86335 RepID=A0AAV0TT11_9STRA|nr:unnamed protein product [Peronospora destructor]